MVVPDAPIDSIQSLEWSPKINLLACASWDCTVKAYEIDGQTGACSQIGEFKNDAPALDLCWTPDGSNIASAGCDKLIKMWNPSSPTPMVVGCHEQPIRNLVACSGPSGSGSAQLVSGGWDKELKYWDPKQTVAFSANRTDSAQYKQLVKPIASVRLEERVYAMDVQAPLVCVALANKKVVVFDLRNAAKPVHEMVTLLKHQLRCIALFPDQTGFAVGSVEGRCAIHYFAERLDKEEQSQEREEKPKRKKSFAFKCHRQEQNVYAVNALKFHQEHGTFASAGGDGIINFWDKDQKQKLRDFDKMELPVTDIDFNYDGSLFAYGISYDWSKGIEHFDPKLQKPEIFIHRLESDEISPKSPKA